MNKRQLKKKLRTEWSDIYFNISIVFQVATFLMFLDTGNKCYAFHHIKVGCILFCVAYFDRRLFSRIFICFLSYSMLYFGCSVSSMVRLLMVLWHIHGNQTTGFAEPLIRKLLWNLYQDTPIMLMMIEKLIFFWVMKKIPQFPHDK